MRRSHRCHVFKPIPDIEDQSGQSLGKSVAFESPCDATDEECVETLSLTGIPRGTSKQKIDALFHIEIGAVKHQTPCILTRESYHAISAKSVTEVAGLASLAVVTK